MAGLTVELKFDEELTKSFAEAKNTGDSRWLKIQIKDEVLVKVGQESATSSPKDDLKKLADSITDENDCFFGLVKGDDNTEWVILAFLPDTSKVKARMQYASALNNLKKSLSGVIGHVRLTEKSEVNWESVEDAIKKAKGDVDNTDALTEAEKERLASDKQALAEAKADYKAKTAMAEVSRGAHAVQFPLDGEAKKALEALGDGDTGAVVILNEKEKLLLEKTFPTGTPITEITKTLGAESRFIFFTGEKKSGDKATVFIYYASDSCPFKKRLQYAASKPVILSYAQEANVEPVKTKEFSDKEDITEEELAEALEA